MATGANEYIDITTADVFLEEVWARECRIARDQKLVFGKLIDRRFEKELQKGQIIRIQDISHLAARAKSANTAITYETVTETEVTLTVDQYYYSAFAIEDIIKVQSAQDLRMRYTPQLGYALAVQEDDTLAGLVDNFSQTVGTLAVPLTDDNLLRADQYLNDANAPVEGRVIVISPAQKAEFMKLDKFIHADYSNSDVVKSGRLGSIYGYEIYVTTNVEGDNSAGHDNGMFQKDALAMVAQRTPGMESQRDIDYLCDKVVASDLFGTVEVRDDHGVWMKGS